MIEKKRMKYNIMRKIRKFHEQEKQWIPDKDFYKYQDTNKLEFLHKKLFDIDGANLFHAEKIENAGDIARELSLKQDNADRVYIFEKIRKINKIYKDNAYKNEFLKSPTDNYLKVKNILNEYKENYLNYPDSKLGVLGRIARDVSIAIVDKDVLLIRRNIEEFEVQYKYWDENIKKGLY